MNTPLCFITLIPIIFKFNIKIKNIHKFFTFVMYNKIKKEEIK